MLRRPGVRLIAAIFLFCLIFPICVFSQTEVASLVGTVRDAQGAAVPGAQVQITRLETGVVTTSVTNGAGFYAFPGLQPGHYRIVVTKPGFKEDVIEATVVLQYEEDERKYFYNVHSSRDVWSGDNISSTVITFDADTGALRAVNLPTGEHFGNTVSMLLSALHFAWVFGLPYGIFVCVLGLLIAMLSYTGIYIWWRKRKTRVLASAKVQAAPARSFVVSASSQG